jgi:hypothetical protein
VLAEDGVEGILPLADKTVLANDVGITGKILLQRFKFPGITLDKYGLPALKHQLAAVAQMDPVPSAKFATGSRAFAELLK